MPDFTDEDGRAARARLSELADRVRDAYSRRAEDPYAVGTAVLALDDDRLLRILGFETWRQMLPVELPELDANILILAAAVASLCSRDDVVRYGWQKVELLTQLVNAGGVPPPAGALAGVVVRVPGAHGAHHATSFSECTVEQLRTALEEAKRPLPPPRKAPAPTEPQPPTFPERVAMPRSAMGAIAAVVVMSVGFAMGGSTIGLGAQCAGLALLATMLLIAGSAGVGEWGAWVRRAAGGVAGPLFGLGATMLLRFRVAAIGALAFGLVVTVGRLVLHMANPFSNADRADTAMGTPAPDEAAEANPPTAPVLPPQAPADVEQPAPPPPQDSTASRGTAGVPAASPEPANQLEREPGAVAPESLPPAPVRRSSPTARPARASAEPPLQRSALSSPPPASQRSPEPLGRDMGTAPPASTEQPVEGRHDAGLSRPLEDPNSPEHKAHLEELRRLLRENEDRQPRKWEP